MTLVLFPLTLFSLCSCLKKTGGHGSENQRILNAPRSSLPFFVAETSLVSVSVATRANGTRAAGQEKENSSVQITKKWWCLGSSVCTNHYHCALSYSCQAHTKNAVLKQFPQDSLCWGCGSGCSLAGKPHVCAQFIACPKLNTSGQANGLPLLHGNTETKLLSCNIDFL